MAGAARARTGPGEVSLPGSKSLTNRAFSPPLFGRASSYAARARARHSAHGGRADDAGARVDTERTTGTSTRGRLPAAAEWTALAGTVTRFVLRSPVSPTDWSLDGDPPGHARPVARCSRCDARSASRGERLPFIVHGAGHARCGRARRVGIEPVRVGTGGALDEGLDSPARRRPPSRLHIDDGRMPGSTVWTSTTLSRPMAVAPADRRRTTRSSPISPTQRRSGLGRDDRRPDHRPRPARADHPPATIRDLLKRMGCDVSGARDHGHWWRAHPRHRCRPARRRRARPV